MRVKRKRPLHTDENLLTDNHKRKPTTKEVCKRSSSLVQSSPELQENQSNEKNTSEKIPRPGCSFWPSQGASHKEKTLSMKKCSGKDTFDAEVKVKKEKNCPSERYRMVMKIIEEGLSQIKREPGASLKVIRAVQMLEEEVNGDLEDDIKPEQKEPFEQKGEYLECDCAKKLSLQFDGNREVNQG